MVLVGIASMAVDGCVISEISSHSENCVQKLQCSVLCRTKYNCSCAQNGTFSLWPSAFIFFAQVVIACTKDNFQLNMYDVIDDALLQSRSTGLKS